eukprot:845705-Pyramimonas_sp.AAC.1
MGKELLEGSELLGSLADQREHAGARSILSSHMKLAEIAHKAKSSAADQLDEGLERQYHQQLKQANAKYPFNQIQFMARRKLRKELKAFEANFSSVTEDQLAPVAAEA